MKNPTKIAIFIGVVMMTIGGGYTIDYPLSEFTFYEDSGFDRIKGFDPVGQPGAPELPAVHLNYIIPANTKVESVIVSQSTVEAVAGSFYIYPAQPPHEPGESLPWVPPDTMIYSSNDLFPGHVVRILGHGDMDGARVVTLEIRPIQYLPAKRKLQLMRNIHIEFCLASENAAELRAQIRGKYEQSVYDAALRAVVTNDNEIPAYYEKPRVVEENQVLAPPPHPELIAPAVIIAPGDFAEAFQPYANWLTDQGIRTIIVSPQTIYLYWSGRDNAEQIRNYMKECYEYGGTYFLFGGDDYSIPVRYGIAKNYPSLPITELDSVPCDLYFSDLTGDWDCDYGPNNGDGYWGELTDDDADCYSEVFVGRVTAYTVEEVENWVAKALQYEKTPGNVIVTHPTQIPVGVQTSFTVTVKTYSIPPVPLGYAKVCLHKPADIYEVSTTDANGEVTFSITPEYTGTMKITATRFHNLESDYDQYRPSQTLCQVVSGGAGGGQSAGTDIIAPEHLCFVRMPTLVKEKILVHYGVPTGKSVDLAVYNLLGARISMLRNGESEPGYYEDIFDVGDLPAGVYFMVLEQCDDRIAQKFLILR